MGKIIAALAGGVLLGILAMFAAGRFGPASAPPPDEIIRDISNVPKMAQAVAEQHREERYASLSSIADIVALPTEFARSEALYAIAGRSDSAGVQKLIFEANRIADDVERVSLLNILFFRLAETDPQSALALARTAAFAASKSLERTVWNTWVRNDLEDALFTAKSQTSIAQQKSAAQSLYAAFGYMGNETTERIEAELGIGPDRSTRSRYLYQLADESPPEAITFINGVESEAQQQEYVSWLAYYLALQDPNAALRHAELFTKFSNREYYSSIINRNLARENPQVTIDRWLANGQQSTSRNEIRSAIRALASTDLEAARLYFEQARSMDDRRSFGSAIASEMAKKDPVEAIAWARAHDTDRYPYLQMSVLRQIAQTDPQLALTEALNTPSSQMRSNMVSNVIQHIAQNNPRSAVAYLDQIPGGQQKLEAQQHLASAWIREDPDAAISWILGQDEETAGQLLEMAAANLVDRDIDATIRLLPKLDAQSRQRMGQQIAQRLATTGSAAEAQAFIQQFEGQPGYDQLQASVISGVAQTDVLMAKQLADQLADGSARDRAYVQIIGQRAQTDPVEAARWLQSVSDDNLRGAAAGQLVSQWYGQDPDAATRWATNLLSGSLRDDALMHISSHWADPTPEQLGLVASIEDRDKRGQAKVRQIYNVMRTDPAKARELLQDEDITSYQRQQVEMMINQYGSRF